MSGPRDHHPLVDLWLDHHCGLVLLVERSTISAARRGLVERMPAVWYRPVLHVREFQQERLMDNVRRATPSFVTAFAWCEMCFAPRCLTYV